ncbi:MAG: Na+/H+ antiporter subunit E [Pirellulaceae bacterium]
MTLFFLNIGLAVVWALAVGEVSLMNLIIGGALAYACLWLAQPAIGPSKYFYRVPRAVRFVLFFLWQVILANIRVAHEVLTPKYHMRPGIIGIPLDAKSDLEITLLANLITLTPGSVSLDVSQDRKVLYVHSMFVVDIESFRNSIKFGFERRLLELMR